MSEFDRMRASVSGRPDLVNLFLDVCNEAEKTQQEYVAKWRSQGYKAAHPNDGWVDRENKNIHFAYPHFNDGATIGDKIIIGWYGEDEKERPVVLTGKVDSFFIERFTFEDAP